MSKEKGSRVLRISQSPAPVITLRNCTYDWTWRSSNQAEQARKAFKSTEGRFIIQLQACVGTCVSACALPGTSHDCPLFVPALGTCVGTCALGCVASPSAQ
jgi:hypothetical protein